MGIGIGIEVGMTWGSVRNSGEAYVLCTVLIRGAKPPLWLQCKIHKPPESFWHSLKSFQLQFQFQSQSKFQIHKIQWNLPYLSFTLPFFRRRSPKWSDSFELLIRAAALVCWIDVSPKLENGMASNDGKTLLPRNLPTLGFFQQRKHGKPMVAMAMTRFELVTF